MSVPENGESKSDFEILPEDEFDEQAYLKANGDVALAVRRGEWNSGLAHYIALGRAESRPLGKHRDRLKRKNVPQYIVPDQGTHRIQSSIDRVVISKGGGILIIGWINDTVSPVDYVHISASGWELCIDGMSIARIRREDVEQALGLNVIHPFGFACFFFVEETLETHHTYDIEISLFSGERAVATALGQHTEDMQLRNILLSYLSDSQYFGSKQISLCTALEKRLGKHIIGFNKYITSQLTRLPVVEYFGRARSKPFKGSIIVCLYGKAEYFFLQTALFSGAPGIEDYEFVYVLNSPELAEVVLRDAHNAAAIYDLSQTVVVLPGNAGFGAANNVAASFARSDRLLIVNPDVFPFDRDWAQRHTDVIDTLPADRTRLFGAPLYYDDGSLMHGGMYFQSDIGVSLGNGEGRMCRLLRVEHYGKGAPPESQAFMRSRPVPAVTGAFISVDRAWFEKLGGFTHDYVFGHYEDADLCLKSIEGGVAPWIHPIRMWHLEGKGSTRLPVHEGGSLINRWLFTHTWLATVSQGLLGPQPSHPLLAEPGAAPAAQPADASPPLRVAAAPVPSAALAVRPEGNGGLPGKPGLVRDVYGWSSTQRGKPGTSRGRGGA